MTATTTTALLRMTLLLATLLTTGLVQADNNKSDGGKEEHRAVELKITKAGSGDAIIASSPAGIDCGKTCEAEFNAQSRVTLTATAASGSAFKSWGGACKGSATTCIVTLKQAQNVTAIIERLPITLNVSKTGTGTGTVTSVPAGIDCGAVCSTSYAANLAADDIAKRRSNKQEQDDKDKDKDKDKDNNEDHEHTPKPALVVTLTANPDSGSTFNGWSGACSGTETTCTVTLEQTQNVSADFALMKLALTVAKTGTGTVTSSPAGIDCGTTCSGSYDWNAPVTLTATPANDSTFQGWSGACTGTATTCTVTMAQAQNVGADFAPAFKTLALVTAGSGTGTVTSIPAGIDCGAICRATFATDTVVTLTAAPATGSTFGGWAGACTGTTPTCTVALSRSRSVSATFSAPAVTRYQYDANGNLTQITDPLGHVRQTQYDALNRPVRELEPHPSLIGSTQGQIDTAYDNLGQIIAITDPRNLTTTYSTDSLGDLKQQTSPDTGVTANSHDAAGNLTSRTDARGNTAHYRYDSLNRISQISDADQTVNYNWDTCANGIGRLCALSNNTAGTTYNYDNHGRLTGKTQSQGSAAPLSVRHSYNAAGQRLNTVSPGGQSLDYQWTSNRLTAILVNGQPLLTRITYEPDGPVNGWVWGNNQPHQRFYDLAGRPAMISLGFDAAGQLPDSRSYGYDAAGRLTSALDDLDPNLNQHHEYDPLDRLTGSLYGDSAARRLDYRYDLSGNRTDTIQDTTALNSYSIDAASNRLQSQGGTPTVNYSYDAAGNLIGDGRFTHRYNAAGRRIASTDTASGQTVSYGYDALGQRIGKTAAGTTTQYFYDEQGHLTGEYDSTGQAVQEIVWLGDLPVAVLKPATGSTAATDIYYLHADHLGTPRKITRPSDNKAVWTWESEAFGNSLPEQNPSGLGKFVFNLRFPGQYYDQETGLFYNVFRDYDAATGRYIQSDPIGLKGRVNTYTYVENNPVNLIDPRGEYAVAAGLGALGLLGAGVAILFPDATKNALDGLSKMISQAFPDDDSDSFPQSSSSSSSEHAECEKGCDLEYDRNVFMCKADAAMRGYNSNRYRQCMNEVRAIYIECIQNCAKGCNK